MKTASTLLQIIALLACFTAYQAFSEERTGVRRTVELAGNRPDMGHLLCTPTRRYAATSPIKGEVGVAPPASVFRKASPQAFASSRTRRM